MLDIVQIQFEKYESLVLYFWDQIWVIIWNTQNLVFVCTKDSGYFIVKLIQIGLSFVYFITCYLHLLYLFFFVLDFIIISIFKKLFNLPYFCIFLNSNFKLISFRFIWSTYTTSTKYSAVWNWWHGILKDWWVEGIVDVIQPILIRLISTRIQSKTLINNILFFDSFICMAYMFR